MTDIKVIFCDIDGTLALKTEVPKSAEIALKEFREQGNLVFLCTGRAVPYVKLHFEPYGNGYICSDGRIAIKGRLSSSGNRTIFDMPFTENEYNEIMARINKFHYGCYVLYGRNEIYVLGDTMLWCTQIYKHYKNFRVKRITVDTPYVKAYGFDLFFNYAGDASIAKVVFGDMFIMHYHTNTICFDTLCSTVDKSHAINHVIQTLRIDKNNTYAFGDNINDLPMFKSVGHTIAMGNAVDELKQSAEFVTTSITEDGLWNGMKHYGLI